MITTTQSLIFSHSHAKHAVSIARKVSMISRFDGDDLHETIDNLIELIPAAPQHWREMADLGVRYLEEELADCASQSIIWLADNSTGIDLLRRTSIAAARDLPPPPWAFESDTQGIHSLAA